MGLKNFLQRCTLLHLSDEFMPGSTMEIESGTEGVKGQGPKSSLCSYSNGSAGDTLFGLNFIHDMSKVYLSPTIVSFEEVCMMKFTSFRIVNMLVYFIASF